MMWRRSHSKKRFNKSEQSLSDMLLMSDLRFDIFVLKFSLSLYLWDVLYCFFGLVNINKNIPDKMLCVFQ